jgi:protein-S-isoprenylcysteine O-methyltransferase Ste14
MDRRIPPPVLAVLFIAIAWGADRLLPGLRIGFAGQAVLAATLAGLGVGCVLAGVLALRSARTTLNPLHPELASRLVVAGIYRRTRNPMYLGLLLVLAAWVVHLGQPAALLLLPAWVGWITRFQIGPEEAALRRLFGATFAAYCLKVRRWI